MQHLNQKRLNVCESIDRNILCIVVEKLLEVVVMVTNPIPESLLSDERDFSGFRHNCWKVDRVRIDHHNHVGDANPQNEDGGTKLTRKRFQVSIHEKEDLDKKYMNIFHVNVLGNPP